MKVLLFIVCVAIIIWLNTYRKRLDKEEKAALKTPGKAMRLRENFGDVLELILKSEDHQILFERSYDESVRIGNSHKQELFLSYSSLGSHGAELRVACTQDSMLIKEWVFDKRRTQLSIYQEIVDYFL